MGYNFNTGHCDEICGNCTYTTCIEHPQHNKHMAHKLKNNIICKVCGKPFDQEVYRQTICSEECRVIWDEQQEERISALTWIKHRGYKNKSQFIKEWGIDTWNAIQTKH